MTTCDAMFDHGSAGLAPTLNAVDCLTSELTATAFGRLFGAGGALMPTLTILLTLYIALFAISLLTGRTVLGMSSMTPRMLTLGMVLTFATSWSAYQQVIWNLTVGGPDWIATVISGAKGSATQIFAQRIDMVFEAINQTSASVASTEAPGTSGLTSPGSMMWLAGLLFMLGTVGLLVTAKISLAVLLMLGPVFIVLAIFPATRGIFVGWLKAASVAALTPMIAVIAGSFMLKLIVPVIRGLAEGGDPSGSGGAVPLFMLSAVHMALMYVVMNLAMTMVSGWTVFGLAPPKSTERNESFPLREPGGLNEQGRQGPGGDSGRGAGMPAGAPANAEMARAIGRFAHEPAAARESPTDVIVRFPDRPEAAAANASRARGIGSRFRSPTNQTRLKAAGEKR